MLKIKMKMSVSVRTYLNRYAQRVLLCYAPDHPSVRYFVSGVYFNQLKETKIEITWQNSRGVYPL